MFAVMCALAGPLLEILGIPGFGVQFYGDSSIGKTIILIVGGSIWGCRVGTSAHFGFTESWATTPEGVERYGAIHNDGFLLLEDAQKVGYDRDIGKLVSTFIMRLADGVTKNRLLTVGAGGDWRVVYFGSSNPPLTKIFSAAGLEFDDAYRVRFPDIPGDAGCGLGVFEDIHGREGAATFAKELRARACPDFGAASQALLERLAHDRHHRFGWLVAAPRRAMARYRSLAPVGSAADGRIIEADLPLGLPPAVTRLVFGSAIARAAQPRCILLHHGGQGGDACRQAEALDARSNLPPSLFVDCHRDDGGPMW